MSGFWKRAVSPGSVARGLLPAVLLALAVNPAPGAAQALLTGLVTDSLGVPISGAKISLGDGPAQAVSDDQGKFRVHNVTPGTTTVNVRRLGFIPVEVPVRVSEGPAAEVRIRMTPVAAPLPAVVVRPGRVKYTGRLAGYYSRLEKKSSGYFISREDIDREKPGTTTQLLAHAPGIRAINGRAGLSGVRMRGRTCWPLVWLDGTPMPVGEVDLDGFVPSSIQGIELYLGSTTAPMRYTGNRDTSSCGTILIWSRGPDTDPIHPYTRAEGNLEELVARLGIYTADRVDRRAQLDTNRVLEMNYPPSLFASRTRGLVIAEFVVDTLGHVEEETVGIVSSTGQLFTDAVRTALTTAVFVPARKAGRAVRQVVQQPFEFNVGSEGGPVGLK